MLRDKAAERVRVGWEVSDVMTPGELQSVANEIERLEKRIARLQHFWIEAAEIAIQRGDFRPLQLRVDASREPFTATETK